MMKRTLICTLAAALLFCGCMGSACACAWFAEPDTARLHRDPFCIDILLSSALQAPVLWYDSAADIRQQGEHALCYACAEAFPEEEPSAPAQTLYYTEEGGKSLHTNPNCPAVDAAYLPMTGVLPATQAADSSMTACPVCTPLLPQTLSNAAQAWNATLAEKAAALPGVWTLPSENAVSPEAAQTAAIEFLESSPDLMAYFPGGLYTVCLYHYNASGDAFLNLEHYRVLITTPLQEPRLLVCVDALTGNVLSIRVAEDTAE